MTVDDLECQILDAVAYLDRLGVPAWCLLHERPEDPPMAKLDRRLAWVRELVQQVRFDKLWRAQAEALMEQVRKEGS